MIARITLILTMLLLMANSPFCRCSAAADGDAFELTGQAQKCSHCCDDGSRQLPCPARPDCCCRVDRMMIFVDGNDTELARESHPTTGELLNDHGNLALRTILSEGTPTSVRPLIDCGGRALLMRTSRLQI